MFTRTTSIISMIGIAGALLIMTALPIFNEENQGNDSNSDPLQVEENPSGVSEAEAIDLSSEFDRLELPDEEEPIELMPERIDIPAIEVTADMTSVGILDNGQMGVPDNGDDVAWFEPGFSPGMTGNAVMAGHVDHESGPAVFYDLDELEEGDEIIVTGDEGEALTFIVQRTESYPFHDSPIEEIFGPSDEVNLNLITCTGIFDTQEGTHEERLVVYTTLDDEAEDEARDEHAPSKPTNVEVNSSTLTWHSVGDEEVVGYRVYTEDDAGNTQHIKSISSFERKRLSPIHVDEFNYYVTSVTNSGEESEPAYLDDSE